MDPNSSTNPYDYMVQRPGRGHPMGHAPGTAPPQHPMAQNPLAAPSHMSMGYGYPDTHLMDMSMSLNPIPYNPPSGYGGMSSMMGSGHPAMSAPALDPSFHHGYMPPARPDTNAYFMMNDQLQYANAPMYPPQQRHEAPRPAAVPRSMPTPGSSALQQQPYHAPPPMAFNPPPRPLPAATLETSSAPTSSQKATSEASYDSSEETMAKSEKRRSQVRDASRRRRAKHKEEETSLVNRIRELKQQVAIMEGTSATGDGSAHPMSAMSDHDMEQAFNEQKKIVDKLKDEHKELKAKLKQHEEFARQLQKGIQHLSGVGGPPMNSITDGFSTMLGSSAPPAQSYDWSWIFTEDIEWVHEVVRTGFQDLYQWKPPATPREPVNASAMGWTSDFWEEGERTMCFSTHKMIRDGILRDFVDKTWGILSNRDKSRRVYPDWKELEVLKWVSEDIVVVRIYESAGSRNVTFCAVVFRVFVDEQHYLVGMKSYAMAPHVRKITPAMRAQEACAWKFSTKPNEVGVDVEFVGYQDLDQPVKSKAGMEAMFVMLRWESEAVTPVFRIEGNTAPRSDRLIQ
ncbi:hypothetical protein ACHHYP_17491 [Achlya hypogyna]|uniref:BZIP domain-containing protein n=1 Tax=Achlya hypogyna TaxID=1202772 RepID=A0A1V9Y473_ACHHY|nr:hypothetical protein ACHHYP_17491 [Achlya hypogyna]